MQNQNQNQNYEIDQEVSIYYRNFKYLCIVAYCDDEYVYLYVDFPCAIVTKDYARGEIMKLKIKDIERGEYFDECECDP